MTTFLKNLARFLAILGIVALAACSQTQQAANGDVLEFNTFEGFSNAGAVLSSYQRDAAGNLVLTARQATVGTGALGQVAVAASGGALAAAINGATARDVAQASACPQLTPEQISQLTTYIGCNAVYNPVTAIADSDAVTDTDVNVNVGGCATCGILD